MLDDDKRNILGYSGKFFMGFTPEEEAKVQKEQNEHFDSIDSYFNDEYPSLEELKIVEKVLKYASKCKWLSFSRKDGILVNGVLTNPLKWGLGYMNQHEDNDNLKEDCQRCGHSFNKSDLNFYDNQILCDSCEDEVKDENGIISDI